MRASTLPHRLIFPPTVYGQCTHHGRVANMRGVTLKMKSHSSKMQNLKDLTARSIPTAYNAWPSVPQTYRQ